MRFPVLLVIAAGCASAPGNAAPCEPVSALKVSGAVYRECAVDTKAKQIAQPNVDMSAFSTDSRGGCWTATFDVVVDTAGVPIASTATLVRANDSRYADAVKAKLTTARFYPAMKDGRRVQQLVRI